MNTLLIDFLRFPHINSALIITTLVATISGYFIGHYLQLKVNRGQITQQSMLLAIGVLMIFWGSVSTMGRINHLF